MYLLFYYLLGQVASRRIHHFSNGLYNFWSALSSSSLSLSRRTKKGQTQKWKPKKRKENSKGPGNPGHTFRDEFRKRESHPQVH
jgi:hypothetical protein